MLGQNNLYNQYIIEGFNDHTYDNMNTYIEIVIHDDGCICTHTTINSHSCAFKYGRSCVDMEAVRTFYYNNTHIRHYKSSKTTFMKGYREAIDNYNKLNNTNYQ